MKDYNRLGKSSFRFFMFWLSINSAVLYRYNCFTRLPETTVFQSKLIFWVLVAFLIPLGFFFTYEKRRNCLSIFTNIMFPLEIYTLASAIKQLAPFQIIVLYSSVFFSVLYFGLVVFQKIRNRNNKKRILRKRLQWAALGSRTIICILLLAIMIPVCLKTSIGCDLISHETFINYVHDYDYQRRHFYFFDATAPKSI